MALSFLSGSKDPGVIGKWMEPVGHVSHLSPGIANQVRFLFKNLMQFLLWLMEKVETGFFQVSETDWGQNLGVSVNVLGDG